MLESNLKPDAAQVDTHLNLLFGEILNGKFEVRCIGPRGQIKSKVFDVGDLDLVHEFAGPLNLQGFNVYLTPQSLRGDLMGQASDRAVKAAHWSFMDFDENYDRETKAKHISAQGLQPALRVNTGNTPHERDHIYFRLATPVPSHELDLHTEAQKRLAAHFGSDKAVTNPSRIMRLAGYISWPSDKKRAKGYVPELVTVTPLSDAEFEISDILHKLPKIKLDETQARAKRDKPIKPVDESALASAVAHLASFVDQTENYESWIAVGLALKATGAENANALWHAFSSASELYEAIEAEAKWQSFEPDRYTESSIFKRALELGWIPPEIQTPEAKAKLAELTHQPEALPVTEARKQLQEALNAAVDLGLSGSGRFAEIVKCNTGLGKTHAAQVALANHFAGNAFSEAKANVFAPTNALQLEWEADLKTKGVEAVAVLGRSAIEPTTGRPTCAKHRQAEALAAKGFDVSRSLCARKDSDGLWSTCEFHKTCAYMRRRNAENAVKIFSHAHLTKAIRGADLSIVDESFLATGLVDNLLIDMLDLAEPIPQRVMQAAFEDEAQAKGPKLSKGRQDLLSLMASNLDRQNIVEYGFDVDRLNELAGLEGAISFREPTLGFGLDENLIAEIEPAKSHHGKKAARIYKALAAFLKGACETPQNIQAKNNQASIAYRRDFKPLESSCVVVLDAEADLDIYRHWWPEADLTEVTAVENKQVIQISDKAFSKRTAGKDNMRLASRIAQGEAAEHKTLLATYKKTVFRSERASEWDLPNVSNETGWIPKTENLSVATYGALRGLDTFKNHDAIVCVGRNMPPIEAIERQAIALANGAYPIETVPKGKLLERSFLPDGRRLFWHPDQNADRVFRQICDAETRQAIGRLRNVGRDKTAKVILLTNQVLGGVVPDKVCTFAELLPNKLEIFIKRFGFATKSAALLSKLAPDLWTKVDDVKNDLKQLRNEPDFNGVASDNSTIFKRYPIKRQFRLKGQRGQDSAAYFPESTTPEQALALLQSALLDLAKFEGAEISETTETIEPKPQAEIVVMGEPAPFAEPNQTVERNEPPLPSAYQAELDALQPLRPPKGADPDLWETLCHASESLPLRDFVRRGWTASDLWGVAQNYDFSSHFSEHGLAFALSRQHYHISQITADFVALQKVGPAGRLGNVMRFSKPIPSEFRTTLSKRVAETRVTKAPHLRLVG